MSAETTIKLRIEITDRESVAALLMTSDDATCCLIFAHGAGAGMEHPFLAAMAAALVARGVATLRFQFPYMEKGLRRPDRPALAHATIRAAVQSAHREAPGLRLYVGGKSFGGRMTSQTQAEAPLQGVRGVIFLGFPLHPVGKPSIARSEHLAVVQVPMLFIAGSRDELADLALLRPVVKGLGDRATLHVVDGADHSFRVPVRMRPKEVSVIEALATTIAEWSNANADVC